MPSYSESLEIDPAPGVFSKRSSTNLLLGRYDAALSDALASRADAPSDWKAYFNAGRAAYGLCDYLTSITHLRSALALNPTAANVRKEHDRCLLRLHEAKTGTYDFPAMHALLSPSTPHLDRASFTRRTAIRSSPHHGRGLFAAEPIPAGALVFAEKAAFLPAQYDPSRAAAALYALTVRQLLSNPSVACSVLSLYPGSDLPTPSLPGGTLIDGVPLVDVFLVEGIRQKNCFSAPLSTLTDTKLISPATAAAKGLWLHAAAMNHSCVPNTLRSFVGDFMISRATRDIPAGAELFQAYVPVKPDPAEREAVYESAWGFRCGCALCERERGSPEAARAKRRELLAQVERACGKRQPGAGVVVPDSVIRGVERGLRVLEEAHEGGVFDGEGTGVVPRLMLVYPCNWLVGAYKGRKNWRKVVRYAKGVVRNFGFSGVPLEEEGESGWDPRGLFTAGGSEGGLMAIHVVAALRRLAEAYAALGEKELAKRCTEASRMGYTMVTGFAENDMAGMD